MKNAVILIGVGEMGGVFARGLLRIGHPVFPVTREMDIQQATQDYPDPEIVVVAVREGDVSTVLAAMPEKWKKDLLLLQNELLPNDWERQGIDKPTVISVWFEKKPGQDVKVIIPSPVWGPHAHRIHAALGAIGIPCRVLSDLDEMVEQLVLKNLYILTTNIAGLKTGGTVEALWKKHRRLAKAVADDVLDIQFRLIGRELNREKLIQGMVEAFEGDPKHKCMGRSAPQRLQRALRQAQELGLPVKTLQDLAEQALKKK